MKNIFLVLVLTLVSNFIFSQEKITKNLGDFNKLKVFRGLNVELIRSDEPKSVVEGEKSEEVVIKNVNGLLKITLKTMESFSADKVNITIYFKNNIDLLDANEGAVIRSDETFSQEKIVLKAQEAGNISINIKTNEVEVKSVTGGKIKLSGFSKNQNASVNTGGTYMGGDLETESTIVKSSTGSDAVVYASKSIDANANLGGTITIKGDPEEVKKKESLGGYIRDK